MIRAKCAPYRKQGKPWHRSRLQNQSDYDIVRIYGAEYRGVVNYYLLGRNKLSTSLESQTATLKARMPSSVHQFTRRPPAIRRRPTRQAGR